MGIATEPSHPAFAAENIPSGVFVTLRASDATGEVRIATNTEADARGLLGYASRAASAGKSILLYTEGAIVPGFTGLVPGSEYWLDVSGVDLYANLSANQWTRRVGVARSTTELEIHFGDVEQVGAGGGVVGATETYTATTTVNVGDTTNNPAVNFPGSGQITTTGNLDAAGGLDVTGSHLTVTGVNIDLDPTGNYTLDMDATKTATTTIADNLDAAYVVKEGANQYIEVDTRDGTETVNLGNATTNPALNVVGSGQITLSGNVDMSAGADVTGSIAATVAIGVKTSLGDAQPLAAFLGAAMYLGEGGATVPSFVFAFLSANRAGAAAGDTLTTDTLGETSANAGITLENGVEIIGVSKVISAPVAFDTTDGNLFSVPAGEVWLIEDMWFKTTVSWDGNGAFVVGDSNDADGYLTLANASLLTTYDESGGITGWPTGSRGLDSANRGVYLTTAVTLNKRAFLATGAYNVLLDNTPGTSTAGSGTAYMRYTRLS